MEKNHFIFLVIPSKTKEKNINRTIEGLLELEKQSGETFEIIAVNDGSKDGTWGVIKDYSEKYHNVIGVNLMANFGQSAAYMAGFDISTGDYVITVSADMETPQI